MVALIDILEISRRLSKIFPKGIPDRNYFIRDIGVKTIFVFLYIDAIIGSEIWLAPKHILRMSNKQAELKSDDDRKKYAIDCMRPGYAPIDIPWYKENTRESIRDETINGLVNLGIIVIKKDVPTTSSKGRYALTKEFSELFKPRSKEPQIKQWQNNYLNESYQAKLKIMKRLKSNSKVSITLPDGSIKTMEPGPSSLLTKSFIEDFCKIHLKQPAVIWISESANKVVSADEKLMSEIGIPLDSKKLLPDLVIAELGRPALLLIFVEIVATDGPFDEKRKSEVIKMCLNAGYEKQQILCISSFKDRNDSALKRRFSAIAKDSLVWCASEPRLLIWIGEGQEKPFVI